MAATRLSSFVVSAVAGAACACSSTSHTTPGTASTASTVSTSVSGSASTGSSTPQGASSANVADAGPFDAGKAPGTAQTGDITVDPSSPQQSIDGFGAADVWLPTLTDAQAQLFFDPVNGIGLSILRMGIETDGTPLGAGAVANAQKADSYGVKVWAAPWSPPATDKDNGSTVDGGVLLTSAYDSWASTLAAFPAAFKAASGVQLYAISAQNEPDFIATYESCQYSAAQMVAFVKVLGPKLAALNPPVKLIAPEPDSWTKLWSNDNYGTDILADSDASAAVNIIATHDYGHQAQPPPSGGVTQPIWETEDSDLSKTAGTDITEGLTVAGWIYRAFAVGRASAWHWWWLVNVNTDGEGLLPQDGSVVDPPKRLYTLGNFSKFVRPGYVRTASSGATPTSVSVVGFANPADGTTVIVAINGTTSAQPLSFFVGGTSWPSQVTPYVTSATENLAAGTPVPLTGARFSATLEAQSVTTFVGKP